MMFCRTRDACGRIEVDTSFAELRALSRRVAPTTAQRVARTVRDVVQTAEGVVVNATRSVPSPLQTRWTAGGIARPIHYTSPAAARRHGQLEGKYGTSQRFLVGPEKTTLDAVAFRIGTGE